MIIEIYEVVILLVCWVLSLSFQRASMRESLIDMYAHQSIESTLIYLESNKYIKIDKDGAMIPHKD
jgi:hypothetical protein